MTKWTDCAEKAKAALLALARELRKIKAAGSNSAKFQTLVYTRQRTLLTVRGEALQGCPEKQGRSRASLDRALSSLV